MSKINLESKKTWRIIVIILVCLGLFVAYLFALNGRYYFISDNDYYVDTWTRKSYKKTTGRPLFDY